MKLNVKDQKKLLQAALGERKSDLAIINANIVNVFTGEIRMGTVCVSQGFICHVAYENPQNYQADSVYDAHGQYLIPGLIDAHVHIESSMMTPINFCKTVLPWGTTTVITDPHEMGNVWGTEGVRYMHDAGSGLPMRQLIDIPSCVPSVPGLENAGADFTAQEIHELAKLERVVGLAEVMDYLAVINGEERMMQILSAAKEHNLYIQGHAPFVSGRMLSAYLCGGPATCHETSDTEGAMEKYRSGMYLDMRDNSMCKNVPAIWAAVKDFRYLDTLCLCTDDRESEDLLQYGHINDVMRIAIAEGMHPLDAIRSATINIAREIRMDHLGAIAPGYVADIVLLPDLTQIKPTAVFYEGQLVAENGQLVVPIENKNFPLEEKNSIAIPTLTVDDFRIKAPIHSGTVKVNVMNYPDQRSSATTVTIEDLTVKDGYLTLNKEEQLKYVAVINRYGKGLIAKHVIRGFGTTHGALASTVSHDSHNLTIVYDNAENAWLALQEITRVHGGMTAVENGNILATLPLPIGGLLSKEPAELLTKQAHAMKDADRMLGLTTLENPLLRIVALALPVIPHAKMSDHGLVDVDHKQLIPLFVEGSWKEHMA